MKNRMIALFVALMLVVTLLPLRPAAAEEDTMPIVLRDTVYGSLTGAFLGGLLLLTTNNKSGHWENVAYGGFVGALAGIAYGVYDTSRSLVEIDKDRITVGLPTLQTDAGRSGKAERPTNLHADLVRWRF
ncbi:MAG: hypothetical protein GXP58_02835 [Deltaproteobacteria bacterium]|nr:hypothetical protein [Deltaproteobacteria bacterium]